MLSVFAFFVFVSFHKHFISCYPDLVDLTPEAITVYRNPEFFKNLNYGKNVNYKEKPSNVPQEQARPLQNYQYPGETKKPNPPPASPGFEVNYDNSPEFHHEPRDIFVDTSYKPKGRKGPYGPIHHNKNNLAGTSTSNVKKPPKEQSEEEEENQNKFKHYKGNEGFVGNNDSEEGQQEFSSELNPNPDEEFRAYHEPILLARDFHPGLTSSTYSQPYAYNKSRPVLYEDWKFYTYPKIHSKEYLKSDSSPLYSEEPASNAFEADESPSYYRYDDEPEETSNLFENGGLKNLEADTKHIYKKLLKPKKFKPSVSLKFHLKPKLKKLKLKLKKGHFHNADWYNEYPFNF